MSIVIEEVKTKKDLKKFVDFQYGLYKDNSYFVPPMFPDEIETFSRIKNPAFEMSEAIYFLAFRDGVIVGRIAGILNNPANKKNGTKNLRFGWVESINDYEVFSALYKAVEDWGREKGMETITGPHGFCDLDPQGMLVDGYDKLATIASYYHHPYYKEHTEKYGFEKDVDFVEFWSTTPYDTGIPERLIRTAELIKKRYGFIVPEYKSVKQYKQRGRELFKLLEESFEENYGTVPLTIKQVDYYIKKYITYIHPELIKIVLNDKDEMIGFMITMPNLSAAYKKANGKLYPFGILHLLKAMKTFDVLDFYFIGVKKEYRGKGVDVLMTYEIVKSAMKLGFKHAESNQELENNSKIQAEWKFFNPVMHKRRRIYKKKIA
jgi:ribosomal protein S18 acetylase RimI-like enzyme